MSGFWERKLGTPPTPSAPTPQSVTPAPTNGQPWWQNPQGVPQQAQAVPFQQGQVVQDAAGNQFVVQNGQLVPLQQQDPLAGRKLPKSAGQKDTCPECGSPDYAITGKGFNKQSGSFDVWKCFDCGYPVKQEFSGMTDVTGAAAGGATKQVSYGGLANNFTPQQTQAPAFAAEQGGPGR